MSNINKDHPVREFIGSAIERNANEAWNKLPKSKRKWPKSGFIHASQYTFGEPWQFSTLHYVEGK
jgi:hypothetical protein